MRSNLDVVEDNVKDSFRLVKTDILQMQRKIASLSETQTKLMKMIGDLKESQAKIQKASAAKKAAKKAPKKKKPAKRRKPAKTVVKKVIRRSAAKKFVGNKLSQKLHVQSCPFAKNTQPKNKKLFKSKVAALNEGYKLCDCAKK